MHTLTAEDVAILEKKAAQAASRYARRVWWADVEEMRAEALAAAVEAATRWYDPSTGVPLSAYAWRACVLRLRNWCWRNSSPVSAPSEHSVTKLRGMHRASWEKPAANGRSLIETHAGPMAVEDQYAEREWRALVREQVLYLIDEGMRNDTERTIAKRILLQEEEPQVVADAVGLPHEKVWRISRRARVLLSENAMLFNYWRDR